MQDFFNFIDGAYVGGAGGRTFDNVNSANGQVIGRVHEAGPAEVDAAVAAARAALQGEWGRLAVAERCQLLDALAREIHRRFDDFLQAEIADTGKPRALAARVDIPRGAANFQVFLDTIQSTASESFRMDLPGGATALSYGVRVPRGVIAVVCPWNLPFLLMTWKVGPALACGNAVVVKPSEETPASATLLGEVMNAVGVPPGVYNVVHGFGPGSAGELLTRHPGVDGITFTGETRTGEAIMKAAAEGLRPVSMELGGKNAALVFADCDWQLTLDTLTRSCFENTGQVCLGTERVYVERPVFVKLVAALKERAEGLRPGDPYGAGTDFGPAISQEHRAKILGYYERARAEGATVVTGGGVPGMPEALRGGAWVQPTIWTGLPETASVVTDEIFGPCCHIAPFDSEDEVLAKVNATRYGLATAVFTQDVSRAHRLAQRIEVGLCWVNAWFLRDLRTPFGGVKQSGIGREGGVHSLEFYTELRNVMVRF